MSDPLVATAIGAAAGFFNAVAGGGTFLTLPLLTELGLDASVANGTNRIGILLQNVASTLTYARKRVIPWRYALALLPASVIGAVAGALLATESGDFVIRIVVLVLFCGMLVLLLRELLLAPVGRALQASRPAGRGDGARTAEAIPARDCAPIDGERKDERTALAAAPLAAPSLAVHCCAVFFGFFGGFIQAGTGLVVVFLLDRVGKVDILRANAIKSLHVGVYTVFALSVFALRGDVAWLTGWWVALGGMLGAALGAWAATRVREVWLKWALLVALLVAGLRFAGLRLPGEG